MGVGEKVEGKSYKKWEWEEELNRKYVKGLGEKVENI